MIIVNPLSMSIGIWIYVPPTVIVILTRDIHLKTSEASVVLSIHF